MVLCDIGGKDSKQEAGHNERVVEDATNNSASPVLQVRECTFAYGHEVVLRKVTLGVKAGRVLVLAGPNGAGKSTLLKVLAGLIDHPSTQLAGKPVHEWSARERADRIAYVPQVPSVAFGFSVRDVVTFGLPEGLDTERGRPAISAALDQVGLRVVEHKPFAHLSAGQQQRAALARAMVRLCARDAGAAMGPQDLVGKALLADEPTSAQDPHHAVRTVALLRGLAARGAGVVVVMHDLSVALRTGDDAILLACDGQVAAEGPVGEVLEPTRLRSVFGVDFALARTASGGLALIAGEASATKISGNGIADTAQSPLPSSVTKDLT
jgi:iron complex transport system ATP-binding protein